MPTNSGVKLKERSTGKVAYTLRDENGDPATPNNLWWSLVDEDMSTIVNEKENESVAPASTVTIALSGADLAILHGKPLETRYLVFEGDYDSDLGENLPINDHVSFQVEGIAKVPLNPPS